MTLFQATPHAAAGSHVTSSLVRDIDAVQAFSPGLLIDIRTYQRLEAFSAQVRALRDLPAGWAGVGTKAIPLGVIGRVTEAYAIFAGAGFPLPSVAPAADGTVQLEWHTERCDLEVHVSEDVVDVYLVQAGNRIDQTDIRNPRQLHAAALELVSAL